jgi:predicted secreted protein
MLKTIFIFVLFGFQAKAAQHQKIDTLGSSPKGQFIAVEEYGYQADNKSFYVTIKVLNLWKKEYVGAPVKVEMPAKGNILQDARQKAKEMAQEILKSYNIVSG